MARAQNAFWPYRVDGRVVGYGTADIEGDPASQEAAFRRAVPALADKPFLLFLGRIHPKKGCDILVEAFAQIAAAHPEIHLVIAGPDPNGLRATMEPVARAAAIEERIHWPGMLSGDVKWGALRACKALVLPSHQENFGVVVAEALAAGRPVLISDQVNICREVQAAGAGMVCTDNVEGTTRMLGDFLTLSADALERMGRAARICFLERFEIGIASDTICAVLEEVSEIRAGLSRERSGPLRLPARERGQQHRSGGETDEVSDLQRKAERKRGQRGRTGRNIIEPVEHGKGRSARKNNWNQAKHLVAGAEQRSGQNADKCYHDITPCHGKEHGRY